MNPEKEHQDSSPVEHWKILNTREVFRHDPWMVVSLQKLELPDGRIVEDYCRLDTPEYVIIVALTEDNNVLMLRQYRQGIGHVSLTLPGGMMDHEGETSLECAKRELCEETGYEASEWESLGSFVPHSNYGCGKGHLFKASGAVKIQEPDSGDLEEQTVMRVSQDDALDALRSNQIVSMSNAAALAIVLNPRI